MIPITKFDIIFVSYDEDNADENWIDLKSKCPWAKRVHGVYGSDASHKAAAEESKTDRFITVDADTIIEDEFFNTELDEKISEDPNIVVSWSSRNAVNGLIYGNGSLKCWTKNFINNMRTHECSTSPANRVEFCFEDGYKQSNKILSTTYPNGSPRQAFRSGFREGVKMCLDQGVRIKPEKLVEQIYWKNMIRLLVWCSIGRDVPNGVWSIFGARLGCFMQNLDNNWDYINVRDFEYLNDFWYEKISPKFESFTSSKMCIRSGYCWDHEKLLGEIEKLGFILKENLKLNIADIKASQCEFFRAVFVNPSRVERDDEL
jgi:hypothetical protein